MRLEEIQKSIEIDSVIDEHNLDTASLDIPKLYHKYLQIFNEEFRILKGVEFEYKKVRKERHQYYLGQASDETYRTEPMQIKVLRGDLDLYLDSDPELCNVKSKFDMQKLKVDTVEKFLDALRWRHNHIRNALDWKKFSTGG